MGYVDPLGGRDRRQSGAASGLGKVRRIQSKNQEIRNKRAVARHCLRQLANLQNWNLREVDNRNMFR